MHVEAPEVRELARRIDLGLERRLRLAEHRGRVERRAPARGEQLRRAQEDAGALLEGPVPPVRPCALRRVDRLRDVLRGGVVPHPEHVLVRVRHHDVGGLAGADLASIDDNGNVDVLGRHRVEPRLELGALGSAGRVAANGLVHRRGRSAPAVEADY